MFPVQRLQHPLSALENDPTKMLFQLLPCGLYSNEPTGIDSPKLREKNGYTTASHRRVGRGVLPSFPDIMAFNGKVHRTLFFSV